MKFEHTEVWGFEHAIRGMRNPKESWNKSDSLYCYNETTDEDCKKCPLYNDEKQCSQTIKYQRDTKNPFYVIGENDMKLMQTLIRAGSEHRKFMRQIFVSVDITAPLYWWKEFDTYKVGTVANSTSTMHKLTNTPITEECFEHPEMLFSGTIGYLENLRITYNDLTKAFGEKCVCNGKKIETKELWKKLIVNLPESWLQTRTVTMNYENVLTMVMQRKNHKLSEWSEAFMEWAKELPYAEELLFWE